VDDFFGHREGDVELACSLLRRSVVCRTPKRSDARGFTLIELMVTVAIVAVLAVVGVYSVRRYLLSASTAEPMEIINSVRAAEESYKDETFGYLPVGSIDSYYPFGGTLPKRQTKKAWEGGAPNTDETNWNLLGVHPSTVVQFGYACAAGKGAGVPNQSALKTSKDLNYPASAGDWYVVRAASDRDGNGTAAIFVGSSFTDQIYGEGESE
jgi:prepilin-type N-terminal cleavage/methylation domain-containing protein